MLLVGVGVLVVVLVTVVVSVGVTTNVGVVVGVKVIVGVTVFVTVGVGISNTIKGPSPTGFVSEPGVVTNSPSLFVTDIITLPSSLNSSG